MSSDPLVGVLALQGDVPEHAAALASLVGHDRVLEVRTPAELSRVSALTLPGGESTTLSRLLRKSGLWEPLRAQVRAGMGVLATCAGLIVLSNRVEKSARGRDPETLGLLDITIRRNDYGRQVESFEEDLEVEGLPGERFRGYFIRAPRILQCGAEVKVMALQHNAPVMVRSGNIWGLTFHPEIGGDPRIHQMFLEAVL